MNGPSFAASARPAAPIALNFKPDVRQRVVREHELQDQRRTAKNHRVAARDRGERPHLAQLHAREHQSHDQTARQPEGRDRDRKADAA